MTEKGVEPIGGKYFGTAVYPVAVSTIHNVQNRKKNADRNDDDAFISKLDVLNSVKKGYASIFLSLSALPIEIEKIVCTGGKNGGGDDFRQPEDYEFMPEEKQPILTKHHIVAEKNFATEINRDLKRAAAAGDNPPSPKKKTKPTPPPPPPPPKENAPQHIPPPVIDWIKRWRATGCLPIGTQALFPDYGILKLSPEEIAQRPELRLVTAFARDAEKFGSFKDN
jgi:hypothetical protein